MASAEQPDMKVSGDPASRMPAQLRGQKKVDSRASCASSSSVKWRCSTTKREASGEVGLFVGGVGRDEAADVEEMRAESEGEWSPSSTRCAIMKHAAATIRTSKRRQRIVRYLYNIRGRSAEYMEMRNSVFRFLRVVSDAPSQVFQLILILFSKRCVAIE